MKKGNSARKNQFTGCWLRVAKGGLRVACCVLRGTGSCELYTSSELGVLVAGYKEQAEGTGRKVNEFLLIFKKTERSDIYKYSICNLQSSIPACPG